MAVAELVLEYLKTVVWPAVTVGAIIGFRGEVKSLLAGIVNMRLPGGTELSWGQLTPEQQRERADDEASELEQAAVDLPRPESSASFPDEPEVGRRNGTSEPNVKAPSTERRERAALAQELVVRQLESEFSGEVRRQVVYQQRPDLQFDAVVFHDCKRRVTTVEVKFVSRRIDVSDIVQLEFDKADRLRRAADVEGIKILLVFVVDADESVLSHIQQQADALQGKRDKRHEIRVYGYSGLKSTFGA